MRLTKTNFMQSVPLFYHTMRRAQYFAIDFEFTGHRKSTELINSKIDTPEDRYWKLEANIKSFFPLQIGITGIEIQDKKTILYPFNIPLWPSVSTDLENSKYGFVNTNSFNFLSKNEFDFNNAIYDGIPYKKLNEKDLETEKLLYKNLRKITSNKPVKPTENKRYSHFSNIQFGVISKWLKSTENLSIDDPKNELKIDIIGIENPQWEYLIENINKMFPKYNISAQLKYDSAEGTSFIILRRASQEKIKEIKSESSSIQNNFPDYMGAMLNLGIKIPDINENKLYKLSKSILANKYDSEVNCIPDLLGPTRFIKYLSNLKKPLIVHNGFLDLLLLQKEFLKELNGNSDNFKKSIIKSFPEIYDTKLIANTSAFFKSKYPNSGLSDIYQQILTSGKLRENDISIHPAFSAYTLESSSFHEAGYDSMITSVVFIHFLKEIKKAYPELIQNTMISKQFKNKLILSGLNLPFDLSKETSPELRENIFVIAGLPKFSDKEKEAEYLEKLIESPVKLIKLFGQDKNYFTIFDNQKADKLKKFIDSSKSGILKLKDNDQKNKHLELRITTYENYMKKLKEDESLPQYN